MLQSYNTELFYLYALYNSRVVVNCYCSSFITLATGVVSDCSNIGYVVVVVVVVVGIFLQCFEVCN